MRSFFLNEKVLNAAGGICGLDYWLLKYGGGNCQYAHSDYHYHELTIMHHKPGFNLLCGYCDNQLREQHNEGWQIWPVITWCLCAGFCPHLSLLGQKPLDHTCRALLVGSS